MLVSRNKLQKIIYENIMHHILFEQSEVTKTMKATALPYDFSDKTKVSFPKSDYRFIPHEKAKQTTQSISPERKAYIIANADSIDPNVYVDDQGNVHSEVTDAERVFLVLYKADQIESNLAAKMQARKEEEERLMQQRIEQIKAAYASGDMDSETTLPL